MIRLQKLLTSPWMLALSIGVGLGVGYGCGSDKGQTPTCGDTDMSKLLYDVTDASPENIQARDLAVAAKCLTGPGTATTVGAAGAGGAAGAPGDSGAD